jgi:hypothetical protein
MEAVATVGVMEAAETISGRDFASIYVCIAKGDDATIVRPINTPNATAAHIVKMVGFIDVPHFSMWDILGSPI